MNILRTKFHPEAAPSDLDTTDELGVQVRRLTKTYGEGETSVAAVRELDLDVRRGEVLLVMGPSGSGKTTLLLMLGGLLRPSSGSIKVQTGGGTVDLALTPERQLPGLRAHTFGFIFQDYALLDALTATENIAVAANLAGKRGPEATARARELLGRVGLTHRMGARPSQMSGGEQQRVAVARALANGGRTWLRVLANHVDVDEVTVAARALSQFGLTWDGTRLASQAALQTPDARVSQAMLQLARDLKQTSALEEADGTAVAAGAPVAATQAAPAPSSTKLSDREREVAELLLLGMPYRDIGSQLFISAKTVEHHVARIRRRLGADSRTEMLSMLRAMLAPQG